MCTEIFIIAVSGGVDSVVLLDLLYKKKIPEFAGAEFVVAHFDHGAREDSASDAAFVEELAKRYGLQFECDRVELREGVSEEEARIARYEFLRSVQKKHRAEAIITAHHQDDVVETAIINIVRGTGWRGLASLDSTTKIKRPLLAMTKKEILDYARQYELVWREDSTNSDEQYLRNHIRRKLIPAAQAKDATFQAKLIKHVVLAKEHKLAIDNEVDQLLSKKAELGEKQITIKRYDLIMWPGNVACEVVYRVLLRLDSDWHPSRFHIHQVVHFVKTAQPKKVYQLSKQLIVEVNKEVAQFKKV